jgi:CPA1 family monovalent cation:H+ antiporter
MHILEGESLLNDASGLVCFRFAVAAVMTGTFSLATASLTFVWVAVAGLAVGVAVTLGVSTFQRWLWRRFGEEPGAAMLVNLLIPFAAYLLAEEIHARHPRRGRRRYRDELRRADRPCLRQHARARGLEHAAVQLQRHHVRAAGRAAAGHRRERATTTMNEAATRVRGGCWCVVVINLALITLRLLWVWLSLRWNLLRARRRGLERRGAELASWWRPRWPACAARSPWPVC